MTIFTTARRDDTGEHRVGEGTRDLTYLIHPPVMRRPEAAQTEVIYLVRPIEAPMIAPPLGLPFWAAPPLPAAIADDLGPVRPPFGEHGVHRRRRPTWTQPLFGAVFLVVLFGLLALAGCATPESPYQVPDSGAPMVTMPVGAPAACGVTGGAW